MAEVVPEPELAEADAMALGEGPGTPLQGILADADVAEMRHEEAALKAARDAEWWAGWRDRVSYDARYDNPSYPSHVEDE
jgi:hypothetical protein